MPSTAKIEQLTATWAHAKAAEAQAKQEAEEARVEILALLGDEAVGYGDDNLLIRETSELDLEDKRLILALKADGVFRDAHEPGKLSAARIREIAKTKPGVARALKRATGQKLRFERPPTKPR